MVRHVRLVAVVIGLPTVTDHFHGPVCPARNVRGGGARCPDTTPACMRPAVTACCYGLLKLTTSRRLVSSEPLGLLTIVLDRYRCPSL